MLKQNDKIEFAALGYTGDGTIGAADGYTVFVPRLIVGEKALVRVTYVKKNVAYAEPLQVLEPSSKRREPPCALFPRCGGCSLMHMDYAEQLEFKRQKAENNLKKIGGFSDIKVLPTVPSEKQLDCRNKISLPVRGKVGNAVIGMFEKGSHKAVNIQNCLLCEWCADVVRIFRDYINKKKIVPYNEKTFSGEVRHLVARFVDGQLLVTIVSNGAWKHDLTSFAEKLEKKYPEFGLFVNENTLKNNVILGDKTQYIYGLKYIEAEHCDTKFRLLPDSFFQVNDSVKDMIYNKVKQLLNVSRTEVLVDCFSGIGILTNVLANEKYLTYAIEIVPQAHADAVQNTLLNNSPNVTNICGDVNEVLPMIVAEHQGKTLSLVVDPPRKGLDKVACETILKSNIDNIVYISCDSATLARDLKILSQNYSVDYVQTWDMFPQTDEVETVAHLKRADEKG